MCKQKVKLLYKGNELLHRDWRGQAFIYTGAFQTFIVPMGLYKMRCEVVAARGQQGWSSGNTGWHYAPPGKGGKVDCVLSVTPGQILYIYVGYAGPDQTNFDCQTPKYNASDIRTNNTGILDTSSLQSRLIVAGGEGHDGANGRFGLGGAAHVGFNVFPAGAGGAGWYGGGGGASY